VTDQTTRTALERVGGKLAVERATDLLYWWIKNDSDIYVRYFAGRDVNEIKGKLRAAIFTLLAALDRGDDLAPLVRFLVDKHAHLEITGPHSAAVRRYAHAAFLVVQTPDDMMATLVPILCILEEALVTA
jgi:hypothetical protein